MKDITASAWIIPIAELKEEIQRSAHITLKATSTATGGDHQIYSYYSSSVSFIPFGLW